jgi:uncharacterized protein YndB with AHSA1/START domain
MKTELLMDFSIDRENNKIVIKREFAAPPEKVWNAWTQKELVDEWWAPKPWKAETKTMDFREGGYWLYAMKGPKGEEHWSKAEYLTIIHGKSFTGLDAFCDKEGNINPDFPTSNWNVEFTETGENTFVTIEIKYDKPEDLEKYIEMGFKEGFTAALENLDDIFK